MTLLFDFATAAQKVDASVSLNFVKEFA